MLRAKREQRWTDAARLAQQALTLAPEQPFVVKTLGNIQTLSGQYEAALRTWKQLQAMEPGDAEAFHGAGLILAHTGRHREALEPLNRALQLDSRNPRTHKVLGDTFAALGDLPQALKAYDRALGLDPQYEEARRDRTLAAIRLASP
jgi:superkiller protein 3